MEVGADRGADDGEAGATRLADEPEQADAAGADTDQQLLLRRVGGRKTARVGTPRRA
ncbi:hypothetical protein [Micromonospora sp. WMMD737]|uniref:hypothetical protein n=1 Tax=Micromonospora sp. WMMD737 TaxID=3404113 RepID=UPI003B93ECFC